MKNAPLKKPETFHFEQATRYFPAEFDRARYEARTSRNHFWLGGMPGQERLRRLKIAVAGLGGMGSGVAELLVRAGVGHLRIADPDTIESTNLNRQVIANQGTVGVRKAEASESELRGITKDFELVSYHQGVTPEMADEFVRSCDAVVDEIDVFPLEAHRALHAAARRANLPIYSSYVVGTGIHFYKFHGDDYTLDDFLDHRKKDEWKKPSIDYLIERFGPPFPSYMREEGLEAFRQHVLASGAVPIFGPSTLLGQSLLAIRMIADLCPSLGRHGEPTPLMPEYLALDPIDLSLKRARMPR